MIETHEGIIPTEPSVEAHASQVSLETGHIWLDNHRVFYGAWIACALAGAGVGWFLQHPVVGAGIGAMAWPAVTYLAAARADVGIYGDHPGEF